MEARLTDLIELNFQEDLLPGGDVFSGNPDCLLHLLSAPRG
jgi:hypothetical protein